MPPHVLVNSALGDVHQSGGQVKVLRKTYRIERERDEFTAYARERVASYFFALCASRAAHSRVHVALPRTRAPERNEPFFSPPSSTTTTQRVSSAM